MTVTLHANLGLARSSPHWLSSDRNGFGDAGLKSVPVGLKCMAGARRVRKVFAGLTSTVGAFCRFALWWGMLQHIEIEWDACAGEHRPMLCHLRPVTA